MQNIINSFKAHLYERTSSPLLGAFIFYWIIFNYKLLIVIFSDLKPIDKFNEINTSVYSTWIEQLGYGLLLPAIGTLIYILYLPLLTNKIQKKWIEHQNCLKKINNESVLTKKEFGNLQRRFTELELSFDDTFTKKDIQITKLNEILNEKNNLQLNLDNEILEYKKKDDDYLLFQEDKIKLTAELKILKTDNILFDKQLTDLEEQKTDDHNNYIIQLTKVNNKLDTYKRLEIEYKELKETVSQQKQELNSYKNTDNSLSLEKEPLEIAVLKYIGNKERVLISQIMNEFDIHRVRGEHICKSLINKEFIIKDGNFYKIKTLGQEFLIKNNLI